MKIRFFTTFLLLFSINTLLAQKKLPIIRATSTHVDIKDDNYPLRKNAWTVEPVVKLDVYTTSAKKVTFYTDQESISFNVDPKVGEYNFIILVNGKDTAITQVKYDAKAPNRNPPAYLDTLRNAEKYNLADKREIPKFIYQSMDNPNLIRIRKDLKLDSIAGNGNELSKVFNLLHWVHNLIRHDGSSNNPTLKNAIDLIKVCKTENRGVNCRMLATVLNECYLAMGITSRYITCMPRETVFDDCHVINMVYIKNLKKWIWIDPTFDAYVMDEKGNLLGLQEVRERLIKGMPLVLNADANWNRSTLQTKEYYLQTYMAKNLYRLETPLISQYDSETWVSGKEVSYVELLPLDGIVQMPQKRESTNEKTGVKFTYYKTNNPSLFWTIP
ncbi:transglutaminase domain-containing protein [Pedobacter frigiditerrae]|uniref:Transglutaminase domain-containing protein n=1 Tax=Pedobacter frigiditerrae TaxID=2530452 RepID=A0A4R0MW26_9SPHI|nr:transglutaminase-like domain-containing protein [Pedobacter frigiditerrae]TCC90124.1 transglutaminase domain-containing protein [Pedobacter frigiditerrae]